MVSERETSKNMIRKAGYMVHSMMGGSSGKLARSIGLGGRWQQLLRAPLRRQQSETVRRQGEESMRVLILPAEATVLKHRPHNRNGASTWEEQLQACGGLCRSLEGLWVSLGFQREHHGLVQLSGIATLLTVSGILNGTYYIKHQAPYSLEFNECQWLVLDLGQTERWDQKAGRG